MKTTLIAFLGLMLAMLFPSIDALAQNRAQLQDVVYLKNGSIIRGLIMEQIPNKSLKIEMSDGSLLVFQMDEVEKITKEPERSKSTSADGDQSVRIGSYAGYLIAGITAITTDYGGTLASIHIVNGNHVSASTTIGLGIGADFFTDGSGIVVLPFWLDARSTFGDGTAKPLIWGHLGYSLVADAFQRIRGEGVDFGAGVGIEMRSGNGTSVSFLLGYEMQELLYGNYEAFDIHAAFGF